MSDLALSERLDGEAGLDAASCEERTWVAQAREGDLQAFDAIMVRYEPRLLRFLVGLVSDIEVARELCQDTFFAAYQALPRLKGELRLSAWLHTIALNRARSHHRRKKFKIFVSIDDHDVPDSSPDLGDSIAGDEAVQRAMSQIPKQYAEVLLLQITGGLTCREIGKIVGCSEGAVKVRLMRARDSFRRVYDLEARGA